MPEHIRTQIIKWAEELKYLVHIIVPRRLELNDDIQYMSVHTFTDTSEKSYVAVVFVECNSCHPKLKSLLCSVLEVIGWHT